ncbi:MAG: hypothetical protein KF767_05240 [Bdellovibrionaceae bacterium]|nr:hypothetical protein [Pseudobdellovibrionaceae bacterium]
MFAKLMMATMVTVTGVAAMAQTKDEGPAAKLISEQKMRVLVQIRPEDFKCKEAHDAGFGRWVPARISFGPTDGDTGWWRNKITDYDERLTRISVFAREIEAPETCADYAARLPRRNEYMEFTRKVWGQAGPHWRDQNARGEVVEVVTMKLSSGLELQGRNLWTDWIIPLEQWNPNVDFDNGLINEFQRHEQKLRVTGQGVGGFSCRAVAGHAEMVYKLHREDDTNVRELRRMHPTLQDCWDAVTTLTQSLEAQGRTWLNLEHDVKRTLWTTFRQLVFTCDTIRAERLELELEGLKFAGTAFISLREGSHECRR